MKDFRGQELKVGDEVVYIDKGACGRVNLALGKIHEFRGQNIYVEWKLENGEYEWCPIHKGIQSVSIMKL